MTARVVKVNSFLMGLCNFYEVPIDIYNSYPLIVHGIAMFMKAHTESKFNCSCVLDDVLGMLCLLTFVLSTYTVMWFKLCESLILAT